MATTTTLSATSPSAAQPPSGVSALLAAMAARGLHSPDETGQVAKLATRTAQALGLDALAVATVQEVATLADLGKLGIADTIINKRGPLTRREVRTLREHPRLATAMLDSVEGLSRLAPLVGAAHERFDGSGYPDGLAGEQIPFTSRLVYACAAYVAMITDRPYRAALSPASARSILVSNAGTQFCPVAANALLDVLTETDAPAPSASPKPSRRLAAVRPRSPQMRMAWARGRTPGRMARIAYPLGALAGLLFGIAWALPIPSAAGRCPPAAEGKALCVLQKVWLHELTIVFVAICAAMILTHIFVFKLPDLYRRWRAGELPQRKQLTPLTNDPILQAATWGWAYVKDTPAAKPHWVRHMAAEPPGFTAASTRRR